MPGLNHITVLLLLSPPPFHLWCVSFCLFTRHERCFKITDRADHTASRWLLSKSDSWKISRDTLSRSLGPRSHTPPTRFGSPSGLIAAPLVPLGRVQQTKTTHFLAYSPQKQNTPTCAKDLGRCTCRRANDLHKDSRAWISLFATSLLLSISHRTLVPRLQQDPQPAAQVCKIWRVQRHRSPSGRWQQGTRSQRQGRPQFRKSRLLNVLHEDHQPGNPGPAHCYRHRTVRAVRICFERASSFLHNPNRVDVDKGA